MRVAVTGASGFVGGALLQALRARGHDVIGLSRRGPDIFWDITSGPLSGAPAVDGVVHCAALVRDGRVGPDHVAVNVDGTRHVLESFPVARFIHMSRASDYNPWMPKCRVREDAPAPLQWLNGYGATKYASEQIVLRLRPDAAILRPHAVYGPDDSTLLPRILRARVKGRQLALGDGQNRITLTAIDNLVDAVDAVLLRSSASGPFNIGDAGTPTVAEVLQYLLYCLGLLPHIVWVPRSIAWSAAIASERLAGSGEPALSRYAVNSMTLTFTLDLSRAQRELGWTPSQTFREGFAALQG